MTHCNRRDGGWHDVGEAGRPPLGGQPALACVWVGMRGSDSGSDSSQMAVLLLLLLVFLWAIGRVAEVSGQGGGGEGGRAQGEGL